MAVVLALSGIFVAALVFWALATANREPNVAEWPDRRAHHEGIVTSATRVAASA